MQARLAGLEKVEVLVEQQQQVVAVGNGVALGAEPQEHDDGHFHLGTLLLQRSQETARPQELYFGGLLQEAHPELLPDTFAQAVYQRVSLGCDHASL